MDLKELKAYHIKDICQFKIYKTRNKNFDRQYIIWNTDYEFKNGHTHRFTIGECESIIQDILNLVEPVRKSGWRNFNDLLISYIRLADNEIYINHVINLCNDKTVRLNLFKEVRSSVITQMA